MRKLAEILWHQIDTARSVEDETRNAELNGNRNPEMWGDISQLVKTERIKSLGISRYKVELRFWLDLNSEESRCTNSNWDFCLIWICSWLKSPYHSGFRLPFNSAFWVSSSTKRAVVIVYGVFGGELTIEKFWLWLLKTWFFEVLTLVTILCLLMNWEWVMVLRMSPVTFVPAGCDSSMWCLHIPVSKNARRIYSRKVSTKKKRYT